MGFLTNCGRRDSIVPRDHDDDAVEGWRSGKLFGTTICTPLMPPHVRNTLDSHRPARSSAEGRPLLPTGAVESETKDALGDCGNRSNAYRGSLSVQYYR